MNIQIGQRYKLHIPEAGGIVEGTIVGQGPVETINEGGGGQVIVRHWIAEVDGESYPLTEQAILGPA